MIESLFYGTLVIQIREIRMKRKKAEVLRKKWILVLSPLTPHQLKNYLLMLQIQK